MIVRSDDLVDWILDRQGLLIAAWAPQLSAELDWEPPFAEVLAGELHDGMVTTIMRGGTERQYFGLVGRLNTGIEPTHERRLAARFFSVSLSLARAASRHQRELRSRSAMPFKRGTVVGDARTDPSHLPLADLLLPADHTFWGRLHPPFGMDCRCGALPMTRGQFARLGRPLTSPAELTAIEAQLQDVWPAEFMQLLGFRKPAEQSRVPAREMRLSTEQFANVMRLFEAEDDRAT